MALAEEALLCAFIAGHKTEQALSALAELSRHDDAAMAAILDVAVPVVHAVCSMLADRPSRSVLWLGTSLLTRVLTKADVDAIESLRQEMVQCHVVNSIVTHAVDIELKMHALALLVRLELTESQDRVAQFQAAAGPAWLLDLFLGLASAVISDIAGHRLPSSNPVPGHFIMTLATLRILVSCTAPPVALEPIHVLFLRDLSCCGLEPIAAMATQLLQIQE